MIVTLAAFLMGGVALAQCPQGPSVDALSCAQAQNFASSNGCYWVDHQDGNGSLPIFPVASAEQLNCGPDQRANPMVEETRDTSSCTVAYQCVANQHH